MQAEVSTIVTCMTDGERPYIERSLKSVFSQNVKSNVILLVECGNDWINEIVSKLPPLELVRVELQEVAFVRNIGVSKARTEYVAFLDGDDFWSPQKLERQLYVARLAEADLVGTNHICVLEDGNEFLYGLTKYIPMFSSWLVRRRVMNDMPFEPGFGYEDGQWWIKNSRFLRVVRLSEDLCFYTVRGNSASSTRPGKRKKEILSALAKKGAIYRNALLISSYLASRAFRKKTYDWHRDWQNR